MDKPTIFFSHSSKDSSIILPIKNKITATTAKVLDIFMSSDGQSIPFGHNWVHKIEEGLNNAKIMFVFVTPTSINSAWIYFEAGFAYSKNIEVIPVGIGVNIDQLKAPLSLLQGFNITSADSLNNFITILNRKFDLNFSETFTELDYKAIFNSVTEIGLTLKLSDIFTYARFEMCSQYYDSSDDKKIIRYDIDKYFSEIKEYLDYQEIQYASYQKKILVGGIQIIIDGEEKEPRDGHLDQKHRLIIKVSMQNFSKSFSLLKELVIKAGIRGDDWMTLEFYFNSTYDCLHDEAAISSVISDNHEKFKYIKGSMGTYYYNDNYRLWIRDINKWESRKEALYVIGISFKVAEVKLDGILDLIEEMKQSHLIFKPK
ncbi:MAG TPA: toll/interleukin-1 receptor domain-containing protein [Clostridiales bacterium]|mgnify:CR=1 FL=1|nr:toll/interleukin-1 receptor domain-containing protein [Clostridiales bacterium]